ncbi:hypothetical protein [Polaribacter sp. HL-MS24]|uniref:hypothetical protein n=1 Tax=Polaribacter sp. HL-MS24 TaxID=3077735 RepID=UPI0029346980|nr:hypothetical protein [Polaribacter sp. HL-MS24]WOC40787.1 hypothetical protein RRF69_03110 [Polaribacter sp. HL-MS24]
MIHYVKRKELHVEKYDDCIASSIQSRIYAFSWYLDIVADHWDVLVLDDYKAVMPLPWRKKLGIKYVYPPLWLLELGIFSLKKTVDYSSFSEVLFTKFKYVELRLNTENSDQELDSFVVQKQLQTLSIQDAYESVCKNYRKDRKKDLQKALKNKLTEKWNDSSEKLIELFRNNVGKRTSKIQDKDYTVLKNLLDTCIQKDVGEILSIYDSSKNLIASGFFLKDKKRVSILISSTDFKNRNNGANTFLIDRAIYKYEKSFEIFNFGGSSMQSIAKYFMSFGAKTEEYQQVKYNNLPFLLKMLKA